MSGFLAEVMSGVLKVMLFLDPKLWELQHLERWTGGEIVDPQLG